jgi:hypothetical protein
MARGTKSECVEERRWRDCVGGTGTTGRLWACVGGAPSLREMSWGPKSSCVAGVANCMCGPSCDRATSAR